MCARASGVGPATAEGPPWLTRTCKSGSTTSAPASPNVTRLVRTTPASSLTVSAASASPFAERRQSPAPRPRLRCWRPSSPRSGLTRCCRPSAGRPGLNLALALSENGVLERYGVKLLGASLELIRAAEDRLVFRGTMVRGGPAYPGRRPGELARRGRGHRSRSRIPLLVRASFALGGGGESWVYRPDELAEAVRKAIAESPIGQAWIEQSIMGWKSTSSR